MAITLFAITILAAMLGMLIGASIGWRLRGKVTVRDGAVIVNMEQLRRVPFPEQRPREAGFVRVSVERQR